MTTPILGASLLVATLEQTWTAIRRRHHEVPEAIVVVAAGSEGRRLRWGHFAAGRWQLPGGRRPEVLVGGEGLRRPAREVLGTLLHEAAHGLAPARGVQDTSRGGRYHNRRYQQVAIELGLEVACMDPIGWSRTTVPDSTAASYGSVLAELEARLVLWRHQEARATRTTSHNLLACTCGCPRRIRVAPATLQAAPILCTACRMPFTPTVDT